MKRKSPDDDEKSDDSEVLISIEAVETTCAPIETEMDGASHMRENCFPLAEEQEEMQMRYALMASIEEIQTRSKRSKKDY